MGRYVRFTFGLILSLCPFWTSANVEAAPPQRIVSLNPCLDVELVELVAPERIAALSHYAHNPRASSVEPKLAASLPITYETAEEIMALSPDLVLASRHTEPATRAALAQLAIRTELFDVPQNIEASLTEITRLAGLVEAQEKGDALVARIRTALDTLAPIDTPQPQPILALIFQPNGFAPGKGTLPDELLTRAGFENATARLGYRQWGNMPLELVLADPPRVLLSGAHQGGASFAQRMVTHPAFQALGARMVRAPYEQKLLYCAGPVLIAAAKALTDARDLVSAAP
jgi:iron complex transport system substrate-binding protein